jgi:hypothetical protein
MTTVDKEFADNLAANAGYHNGDSDNSMGDNPRCVEITEYDNAYGGIGYGLTFEGRPNRYTPTEFVRNPRLYWQYAA